MRREEKGRKVVVASQLRFRQFLSLGTSDLGEISFVRGSDSCLGI